MTHDTTGELVYIYSYSRPHCVGVCGDVGMVGKKIPLTTWWLGVVKGGVVCAMSYIVGLAHTLWGMVRIIV